MLFSSDMSSPNKTFSALVTRRGVISFCTLAWAKTTESLVRVKADEGLDFGALPHSLCKGAFWSILGDRVRWLARKYDHGSPCRANQVQPTGAVFWHCAFVAMFLKLI